MTSLELSKFTNRHIRFKIGDQVFFGVIWPEAFSGRKSTHFTYIPTNNMIEWKSAQQSQDKKKMDFLARVVDIETIVEVQLMPY